MPNKLKELLIDCVAWLAIGAVMLLMIALFMHE